MRDVTPGNAAQSKGFLSEKRQSGPTDDFEQQHRVSARAGGRRPLRTFPSLNSTSKVPKKRATAARRSFTHLILTFAVACAPLTAGVMETGCDEPAGSIGPNR